jgi:hypothetical protein
MKLLTVVMAMVSLIPRVSVAFLSPLRRSAFRTASTLGSTETQEEYDLVVIGAGSGGVRASRISAGYGKKVAILEPQLIHGAPNYSAIGGTVSGDIIVITKCAPVSVSAWHAIL